MAENGEYLEGGIGACAQIPMLLFNHPRGNCSHATSSNWEQYTPT